MHSAYAETVCRNTMSNGLGQTICRDANGDWAPVASIAGSNSNQANPPAPPTESNGNSNYGTSSGDEDDAPPFTGLVPPTTWYMLDTNTMECFSIPEAEIHFGIIIKSPKYFAIKLQKEGNHVSADLVRTPTGSIVSEDLTITNADQSSQYEIDFLASSFICNGGLINLNIENISTPILINQLN
jgi:hypothetical protein